MIALETAKKALDASENKAREIGTLVATVIVDEHGKLIAASRMDGALYISPEFALSKAYTSANLQAPTAIISGGAEEGKPYFGIQSMLKGKLSILPGGIPVVKEGKVVGAVGVGGSIDPTQDVECAEEAKKILES